MSSHHSRHLCKNCVKDTKPNGHIRADGSYSCVKPEWADKVKVVSILEPAFPIIWCGWCSDNIDGYGFKDPDFFGKRALAICVQCKDRLVKERPNDVIILYGCTNECADNLKVVTILEPFWPIFWCDFCADRPSGEGYRDHTFFGEGALTMCVPCRNRLVKERPNDVTILYE